MTGNPLVFKGQHALNALLGIAIVVGVVMVIRAGTPGPCDTLVESPPV